MSAITGHAAAATQAGPAGRAMTATTPQADSGINEGVLGASTNAVFGIGKAVTTAGGASRSVPAAAVAGAASLLEPGKALLILVWLALNAGFVLIRKRRGSKAAEVFRPITLGGWTYGSRTGLGA